MIITTGGIKGGDGKSTIATALAKHLNATLIDCDNRQRCAYIKAQEMGLASAVIPNNESEVKKFMFDLKKSSTPDNLIIFDTGGKDTKANRLAFILADLLIIPFGFSPMGKIGLEETLDLIDELNINRNPKINYRILLNNIDHRTSDFHKGIKYLETKKLPHYLFCIGRYKAIPNAIEENKSIFEMNDEKAKFCFEKLIREINKNLFNK